MKKILVVDDHDKLRGTLKALFEMKKFHVETASDGGEALEVVKSWIPDLILMDIQMPRMNGIEACRTLKSSDDTKEIPIILTSAFEGPETLREAQSAGADLFLPKSYGLKELLEITGNMING